MSKYLYLSVTPGSAYCFDVTSRRIWGVHGNWY